MAFVKITGYLPALLFLKPKVYYAEKALKKLPKPCILMSNHTSLIDFVLYLILFPFRNIRFLMAEVLFNKSKLFSWFLFKIGGIFVDRDAFDFSFVGETIKVLENKETVGIFPQGRLPMKGISYSFKPSVVYIALRCNYPIIPVYTNGVYSLFKRARVVIGEPIYLKEICKTENPSKEELEELTQFLEDKTYKLAEEIKSR